MSRELELKTYSPDMHGFEVDLAFPESGGLRINLRYGKEYLYEQEGIKNTIDNLEKLLEYFKSMENRK